MHNIKEIRNDFNLFKDLLKKRHLDTDLDKILELDKENRLWLTISFLCGFTALAYEVVWTRLLVFGIGSTVYSFCLMLANFLFGITVGWLLVVPFFK